MHLPRVDTETLFRTAALATYVVITFVVLLHHEPWRDEADPWLYARDADLRSILTRTGYVGAPAVWYLLLVPLARSGLPYLADSLLQWALAVGTAVLILWRAPLGMVTRALFTFSYFLAYEYAVVARSYTLSVLLIFAIAATYPARLRHPITYALLVATLANTNAHSLVIAGAMAAAYLWELSVVRSATPRRVMALGLMAAGGALAVWQLRPPADGNIVGLASMVRPVAALQSLDGAFAPQTGLAVGLLLGVLAIGAATVALRGSPRQLVILWGSYAGLFSIFVFKYTGGLRHFGFLLVVLVFVLWTARDASALGEPLSGTFPPLAGAGRRAWRLCLAALHVSLLISVLMAAFYGFLDFRFAYSGGQEMARYIHQNHLDDRVIAAHPAPHTAAVLPYLPGKRFWFAGIQEYGSYMLWDVAYRRGERMTATEAMTRVGQQFGASPDVLVLLNAPMPAPSADDYELLFATADNLFEHADERFFLYRRRS